MAHYVFSAFKNANISENSSSIKWGEVRNTSWPAGLFVLLHLPFVLYVHLPV